MYLLYFTNDLFVNYILLKDNVIEELILKTALFYIYTIATSVTKV